MTILLGKVNANVKYHNALISFFLVKHRPKGSICEKLAPITGLAKVSRYCQLSGDCVFDPIRILIRQRFQANADRQSACRRLFLEGKPER
jgi:hypothetical protein